MIDYKYIENEYKPSKITKINNTVIIDSNKGKYLIKDKNKDLYSLFNYLYSRNYSNYPTLINNEDTVNNIFKYEDNINTPINQKLIDLANITASLHNKTVYFKNISIDKIKEVRDIILSNINYTKDYYYNLFIDILKEEYYSPSKYLFARNYYKLNSIITNAENKLDSWQENMQEKSKIRVCINHNNLALEHFITSEKQILTSWDNYIIDTPIIDIVNLYKKEYLNIDFSIFLDRYFKVFPYNEEEKQLLFIIISIPNIINFNSKEINNIKTVHNLIDYLDKTEKLIRPYYSNDKEE